ncbi:MAG: response regulator [Candidatus Heimdallarchaeota archaeon]|nr:response regulator [Candidatus Heimdallarchaeota archaeon]
MKLLLIEDNPVNMKLLTLICSKLQDLELIKAEDGEIGLEKAISEKPEIILTDIQMPKMTGIQILEEIRKIPEISDTIIIAVTAHALAGEKERLLSLGFDEYISKPLDTKKVRELIQEYQQNINLKNKLH